MARDKGSLDLSFNPEGQGPLGLALTGKDRATLEEILGLEPIPKPPAPPAPFISQIYRGAGRRQYEFRQVGSKMMEFGGGAASIGVPAVPQGQNAPAQNAPGQNAPDQRVPGPMRSDPNGRDPEQPGVGNDAGMAPPAPPAPGSGPGTALPDPAAPESTINLQAPQPPAPSEKLF